MKRILMSAVLALASFGSSSAHATVRALSNVDVTTVKLENYTGAGVVLWNVFGSTCSGGKLQFGPAGTPQDHDRLWSLITAAKLSGKKVFVQFDDATPNCNILSFGLN